MSESAAEPPHRRRLRAALLALGLLALVGVVAGACRGAGAELDPAPDFTIPLYQGGADSFHLADQQGRLVVLNFWASWCAPCRAEFPEFQRLWERYGDRALVVGVAIQDTEVDALAFLEEQGISFFAGPDITGQISQEYMVTGLPTTVFITSEGTIYKRWVGQLTGEKMTTFVEEVLALG